MKNVALPADKNQKLSLVKGFLDTQKLLFVCLRKCTSRAIAIPLRKKLAANIPISLTNEGVEDTWTAHACIFLMFLCHDQIYRCFLFYIYDWILLPNKRVWTWKVSTHFFVCFKIIMMTTMTKEQQLQYSTRHTRVAKKPRLGLEVVDVSDYGVVQ